MMTTWELKHDRTGSELTEAALVAGCRRGEEATWNALFERYYAATGRYVLQLGYDLTRQDVEEICQEVFLSVIRGLPAFRGRAALQTWIFRIARNKMLDYLHRQRAAKRGGGEKLLAVHADDPSARPPVDPPSPWPGPDALLMQAEAVKLMGWALARLDTASREILELRYTAGMSYGEIAARLDLHPKTVGSRLSKSLRRLTAAAKSCLRHRAASPVWEAATSG